MGPCFPLRLETLVVFSIGMNHNHGVHLLLGRLVSH
jgi:hypothetical protein